MADNTTLNVGTQGDVIRTLDRTGTGAPKTEVVTLDLAGPEPNAEKLLAAGQAAMANSVPVVLAADYIDPRMQQLVALKVMQLQVAIFSSQTPGGFQPMEVPAFLGV